MLAVLVAVPSSDARAQTSGAMQISWEVRNRFRLFKEERDFLLHVEAARNRSILEAEQALAIQSDGRGWARNTLARLCIDQAGKISQPCTRDNVGEDYLTPADHNVTLRVTGQVPAGAICAWRFEESGAAQESSFDCAEPINIRVRYGVPTMVTVDVNAGPEVPERLTDEIQVRDILIAGLGDSIASGEGNPDRPVELSGGGFCFRTYLGGGEYYRPGRARFEGDKSCGTGAALCRHGSASTRNGRMPPATARSTATRPARRSRSPSGIRTSPSPTCRSPAPAPPSAVACSDRSARANASSPATASPARARSIRRSPN